MWYRLKLWASGCQGVLPGPAALTSPGDLFQMQIFRSHPRSPQQKLHTVVGPAICAFTSLPGDSVAGSNLRSTALSRWSHSLVSTGFRLPLSLLNCMPKAKSYLQTIISFILEEQRDIMKITWDNTYEILSPVPRTYQICNMLVIIVVSSLIRLLYELYNILSIWSKIKWTFLCMLIFHCQYLCKYAPFIYKSYVHVADGNGEPVRNNSIRSGAETSSPCKERVLLHETKAPRLWGGGRKAPYKKGSNHRGVIPLGRMRVK